MVLGEFADCGEIPEAVGCSLKIPLIDRFAVHVGDQRATLDCATIDCATIDCATMNLALLPRLRR